MSNEVKHDVPSPSIAPARDPLTRAWTQLLASLGAAALAATLVPTPAELIAAVVGSAPRSGGSAAAVDAAALLVAGAVIWALLAWLSLVTACALIAWIPGSAGFAGRRWLRRIAPAAAGRLVAVTVGIAMLGGASACTWPALASNEAGQSSAAPSGPAEPTGPTFDIDWPQPEPTPATPASPASASEVPVEPPLAPAAEPAPPTPAPQAAPASPPTPAPQAPPASPPTPAPQAPPASPPTPPPPTSSAPASPAAASIAVQPGDSLWRIASRTLPTTATDAQIDLTWRAWYEANADVIGLDPDLIMPGQVLQPPSPAAEQKAP